ncbi:MAG: exodeoxyribonuclease III [Bordetella sp.]|nr:MAG: exodeoxyribonuclease III [Bordetella sp.]
MKIATWNVNSLNVRLEQVIEWLKFNSVDVLCLQEIKMINEKFPSKVFSEIGYHCVFSGQKTYNGVAIISKKIGSDILYKITESDDAQKRFIAMTISSSLNQKIRIICIYCPNGQSIESEKYIYKLKWFESLYHFLKKELKFYQYCAILGDYNVAPSNIDTYNPEIISDNILISKLERKAFNRLLKLGLFDAFRLFEQPEKSFTWWDYRRESFKKNIGFRIDHILLSKELCKICNDCSIDFTPRKKKRPSDHTPVIATLDF